MAVYFPSVDITETAADTPAYLLVSDDVVILRREVEVAAIGTGDSAALRGVDVSNVRITVQGSLHSAFDSGIELLADVALDGSASNTVTVAAGGLVSGVTGVAFEGGGNTLRNSGEVLGTSRGLHASLLAGSAVAVENAGLIIGGTGVDVNGAGALFLNNSGEVRSSALLQGWAIRSIGASAIINNDGLISGGEAIAVADGAGFIRNDGEITGINAITFALLSREDDFALTIVNGGTISALFSAIQVSDEPFTGAIAVTLRNTGTIVGDVTFGRAADSYDGTDGLLDGPLAAGNGADTLIGGKGRDRFDGEGDDDTLLGRGGDDRLLGGAGDDEIAGGAGDDWVEGGAGADDMDGGAGIDTLSYAGSTLGVDLNLLTGELFGGDATGDLASGFERVIGSEAGDTIIGSLADDTVNGAGGADSLTGGGANDRLLGGAGQDSLDGGSGNDVTRGGAGDDRITDFSGNDRLWGDAGADTLTGGAGRDTLHGGAGNDVFRFTAITDSSPVAAERDRILDWASGDRIDLSAIDAVAGGTDDAFTPIGTAVFTNGVAGRLRVVKTGNDMLVQAEVNGDAVADFSVLVRGVAALPDSAFLF